MEQQTRFRRHDQVQSPPATRPDPRNDPAWTCVPRGQPDRETQNAVFLDADCYSSLAWEVSASGDAGREVGGFLLGWPVHEEGTQKIIGVWIQGFVQGADSGGVAHYDFTASIVDRITEDIKEDPARREMAVVGWYHTHPRMTPFLSEPDECFFRTFHLPHQVALVVAPRTTLSWARGGTVGAFFAKEGVASRTISGFWEVRPKTDSIPAKPRWLDLGEEKAAPLEANASEPSAPGAGVSAERPDPPAERTAAFMFRPFLSLSRLRFPSWSPLLALGLPILAFLALRTLYSPPPPHLPVDRPDLQPPAPPRKGPRMVRKWVASTVRSGVPSHLLYRGEARGLPAHQAAFVQLLHAASTKTVKKLPIEAESIEISVSEREIEEHGWYNSHQVFRLRLEAEDGRLIDEEDDFSISFEKIEILQPYAVVVQPDGKWAWSGPLRFRGPPGASYGIYCFWSGKEKVPLLQGRIPVDGVKLHPMEAVVQSVAEHDCHEGRPYFSIGAGDGKVPLVVAPSVSKVYVIWLDVPLRHRFLLSDEGGRLEVTVRYEQEAPPELTLRLEIGPNTKVDFGAYPATKDRRIVFHKSNRDLRSILRKLPNRSPCEARLVLRDAGIGKLIERRIELVFDETR